MVYIWFNKNRQIPGKWDVVNTSRKTHDVCITLRQTLVYFLWNLGVPFTKATKIMRYKKEENE